MAVCFICSPVVSSVSGRWPLAAAGPLSLFMLPVEGALLVRDGDGHLSLWFDAARDDGPQLTPILTYAVTLDDGAGAPGWFRRTRRRGTVNLV
ncbi:hypothetical protein [Sodalis glossinidius]|uniref:hypothetical protein n=1 Tax=Sodalis glossinidius TaxID=63612 RepID=UPI0002E1073A|nr:hypothetical protein [Sodalis glossinidius]